MIKRKSTIILIAIILLFVAFFGGMFFMNNIGDDTEPVITSDTIANEIKDISEYASLEYKYTNVGRFEDQINIHGWDVPFTSKNFIITYDGSLRFGISGEDIEVSVNGNTINVVVPDAKILSHEIKEDSIEVLDQTKNVFNPIQVDDYTGFAAELKSEIEAKAEADGMYEEATEAAKTQLGELIRNFPGIKGEYEVKFI